MTDEDEKTNSNWTDSEPGPAMDSDIAEFVRQGRAVEEWPSATLRPEDVPSPTATCSEICSFAGHLNGYHRYGFHGLYEAALASVDYFKEHRAVDPSLDLDQVRSWLWAEYRAARYAGHAPSKQRVPYIRALLEAIRSRVEDRARAD